MRVLFSGGEKTMNIVDAMRDRLSSGTVEFTHENFISNMKAFVGRGDLFDKAIIMQESVTEDGRLTEETDIRNNIANFMDLIHDKFVRFEVVFVVLDEEMARMVSEETFLDVDKIRVVIEKPKYSIKFFKDLILNDIARLPDRLDVYNYSERAEVECGTMGNEVSTDFDEDESEFRVSQSSSNDIDITEDDLRDENDNELEDASFDSDDFDSDDFDLDGDDNDNDNEFGFGSIDEALSATEDEVDNINTEGIESNTEFAMFGADGNGFDFGEDAFDTDGFDEEQDDNEFNIEDTDETDMFGEDAFNDADGQEDELFDSEDTDLFDEEDTSNVDETDLFGSEFDGEDEGEMEGIDESELSDDFDGESEVTDELFESDETDETEENLFDEDENPFDSEDDPSDEEEPDESDLFEDGETEEPEDFTVDMSGLTDDDFLGTDSGLSAEEALENSFEMGDDFERDTLEESGNTETDELFDSDEEGTDDTDDFDMASMFDEPSEVNSNEEIEDNSELDDFDTDSLQAEEFNENTFEMESGVPEKKTKGTVKSEKFKKKLNKVDTPMEEENTMDEDMSGLFDFKPREVDEPKPKSVKPKLGFGGKSKSKIKPIRNNKNLGNANKEDKMSILSTIMNSSKHKGNIIVVTGTSDSGKTTVASNLANVICDLGFEVLVVDMDTKNRGQSFITKDVYESVHEKDSADASLRAGVNTASTEMTKFAHIIKPGYHMFTTGLASDIDELGNILNLKKLGRFMSSARTIYNYVIIDVPFEECVTTVSDICEAAEHVILTVEPSNHGMMEFLIDMTNIQNEDVQESLYSRAGIVFNKVLDKKTLFGQKVSSLRDMLAVLDNTFYDLVGYMPESRLEDMNIMGVVNYSSEFDEYLFGKQQISDTKSGADLFLELLYNILVNRGI